MRAKPPSIPSALARREAARILLAGAVDCRDAQAVLSFTGHWVHRQGMGSLPALMAELAQGETLLWWQSLLQQPIESVGRGSLPAQLEAPVDLGEQAVAGLAAGIEPTGLQATESPASEQPVPGWPGLRGQASQALAPDPPASTPGANTEAHGQDSNALEINSLEINGLEINAAGINAAGIKPVEVQSVDIQSVDIQSIDIQSIDIQSVNIQSVNIQSVENKATDIEGSEVQPGELQPAVIKPEPQTEAAAPTALPTEAKAPVPVATAVPVTTAIPVSTTMAPASRPAVSQGRRGAGTSRPAPAPRNPELARLRAWLPDSDSLGGASRRSHAA